MKKLILFLFTIYNISAQTTKRLNNIFANALISDTVNNIQRKHPIIIIAIDKENNPIKTNYENISDLFAKSTNNVPWFITQSEEATTIVEIKNIDIDTSWITLGKTLSGFFNMDDGETLEFFNPFVLEWR
jgi:hypothetical protein